MSSEIGWIHPVNQSDQWDGFNDPGIEHFRGKPIQHLAREAIQNAFDAGESTLVKVKISLHKVDACTVPNIEELKENLKACHEVSKNETKKEQVFFEQAVSDINKNKLTILEISDSNTSGMRGPSEHGTPFFAFMKAKGQSVKSSNTATGSYGIGKFAPYAVSNIRTIFVSTVYQDDTGEFHQLTQGKSILMSHDIDGRRRQGEGYWGIKERCKPIEGISQNLPSWILRSSNEEDLPNCKGSKLTILCFDDSNNWQELLAVSVAENFFGAINEEKLSVDIDGQHLLNKDSIVDFFDKHLEKKLNDNSSEEHEKFDNCVKYLEALQGSPEVIVEESEMHDLGLCQVRILIGEGLPKKVCALRNGMFITDRLNGLKQFSDFKEFVAVFHCQSEKGNELLRAMEPPRHDDFEPDRLATKSDKTKGKRALNKIAKWIREMLKRHAKDPVSEITEIDELRDFFGDEGEDGSGKSAEEINPYGDVIIRAKPIKYTVNAKTQISEETQIGGGEGDGENTGKGVGDDKGGIAGSSGGTGGGDSGKASINLRNVRAVLTGSNSRNITFTPDSSAQIILRLMEAGADNDYDIAVTNSNKGKTEKGGVVLCVEKGSRVSICVDLSQDFQGALKVIANEV